LGPLDQRTSGYRSPPQRSAVSWSWPPTAHIHLGIVVCHIVRGSIIPWALPACRRVPARRRSTRSSTAARAAAAASRAVLSRVPIDIDPITHRSCRTASSGARAPRRVRARHLTARGEETATLLSSRPSSVVGLLPWAAAKMPRDLGLNNRPQSSTGPARSRVQQTIE
jgi:hypothetical protein